MKEKKDITKGFKKITIEEPTCCQHAERFWQEIDGIVDGIDGYNSKKKEDRLSELEEAFGSNEAKEVEQEQEQGQK